MLHLLYTSFIKHQATRGNMKNNPKNHESFPPQKINYSIHQKRTEWFNQEHHLDGAALSVDIILKSIKYNCKNVNFSVRDIIIVKRRSKIYTKKQVKTSPTLRLWADQRLVTNNMVFQHVKL